MASGTKRFFKLFSKNLDFANRSANILTCDRCGYVHWFNKDIKKVRT